ncbi:MAG: type II toxin-antitoxin system RelE/ParE family toxin [Bacteroidota bacterium]|nr:type II toxin-antitoxin system RelE/ParE family toxin [Bacteroidota bacterium]
MVKIVWTTEAIQERDEIFKYWNKRNHSNNYSKKLRALIREALDTIRNHPEIGKPTLIVNTKIKVIKDYLLVYRISENNLIILAFWDSRQNPVKLDKIIEQPFL